MNGVDKTVSFKFTADFSNPQMIKNANRLKVISAATVIGDRVYTYRCGIRGFVGLNYTFSCIGRSKIMA